jgi:uncharacterized protein Yka (UPF0111/DUF47 family)
MPDNEVQSILVNLAKLETKIDSILKTLETIPDLEKRVREVEKFENQIDTNTNEIDRLRNQNNLWNGANSLAAFIAMCGAYFGIGGVK